jgi:hypothetical protein
MKNYNNDNTTKKSTNWIHAEEKKDGQSPDPKKNSSEDTKSRR